MDAIYNGSNSFRVFNNVTSEFVVGRRVKMNCGLDGLKYASVVSSSYSAPYTTVQIDESNLTASLTDVWYAVVTAGSTGSIPDHLHDTSEGSGGQIASGATLLRLDDTPTTYSGSEGLFLRVDATASGTEFATVPTSGTDDHTHAAYVPWDFGAGTISGTGDIYCNDIYTASGTVYIGNLQLTTDGTNLLVDGQPIEATTESGVGRTTYVGSGVPTINDPIAAEQYDYYIDSDTSNMYERQGEAIILLEDDFTGSVLDTGTWSTRTEPDGSITQNDVLEINNSGDHSWAYVYTTADFTKSRLYRLTCRWLPNNDKFPYSDLQPPMIVFRDAAGYSADGTYGYAQAKCFYLGLGNAMDSTQRTQLEIWQNTSKTANIAISIDENVWHDLILTINCDTREFSVDLDSGAYTLNDTISQSVWDSINSFVLELGACNYTKVSTEGFDDLVLTNEPVNTWSDLGHTAGTFLSLPDTPSTYSGTDGQYLMSTGSGVEWSIVSGVQTFLDLTDTPSTYLDIEGNYLRTTSSGITTVSGIIIEAPNGSEWLLQVTNSGILYNNGGSIMAYLYVNPDGVTRPYSTITDALTAASTGDTLVLDPGTYVETVYLNKFVNIRGNTNTPENNDITINPYPTRNYPSIRLDFVPTVSGVIHIEGVTLYSQDSTAHYQAVFDAVAQNANQYVSVVFNRCRFKKTGGYVHSLIRLGYTYFDRIWLDHCEWEGVTSPYEFSYVEWTQTADSRVLACVYDGDYGCYSCAGSPDIHNYVTTPTEGYGISYSSDWYVPLDYPVVGYFDGYVMEEGGPVQRTVNLYKRTNGEFLGTTTSNPSGYYYIETTFSGMHYVVCLDAPADPLYNDLIIGSAYPTAL